MIIEGIRKISKDFTQRMIFFGLIVLIFVLPIPQFFKSIYLTKDILIQTTLLRVFLIYFTFFFVTEAINKRVSFRNNKWVMIGLIGLVITGFASVVVAENWILALYGLNKGEGYFSLLSYYMIFLVTAMLRKKQHVCTLIRAFLMFGCVVTVLGVVQFTGIYEFGVLYPGMAYVPLRNPNYYGAFAVLFTGVSIGGFYLYDKNSEVTHPYSRWNRWVWYGLVLFGYIACICAASTLVYVGLIMIFLLYAFLELVSKRRKFLPLLALVGGLVIVIFLFDLLCNGAVIREIFSVGTQIKEEGSVFGDTVGTSRILIWKQTLALLPKYGLFGTGLEQLGIVRMKTYGAHSLRAFDKAHNEYLNLWVTEGIFALIFYLIFLFAIFIPGVKQFFGDRGKTVVKESDEISKIAFFAFFGYIAQAFFNISVVQVAPYFWMMCGLLFRGQLQKKRKEDY